MHPSWGMRKEYTKVEKIIYWYYKNKKYNQHTYDTIHDENIRPDNKNLGLKVFRYMCINIIKSIQKIQAVIIILTIYDCLGLCSLPG